MLIFKIICILQFCKGWGRLIEGDIAVSRYSNASGNIGVMDTFLLDSSKLWPNGIVPYVFDTFGNEPLFKDEDKNLIRSAMRHISHGVPCITFREVNIGYKRPHIIFSTMGDDDNDHNGCWSYVGSQGAIGGREGQTINLGSLGCFNKGIVLHEILHALGAEHEQNRKDRDQFVRVLQENILDMKNFKKTGSLFSSHGTPYDYNSIMHYDDYDFSSNGNKTIIPVKQNITLRHVASKSALSTIDIMELARVYDKMTVKECFRKENLKAYLQIVENQCKFGSKSQETCEWTEWLDKDDPDWEIDWERYEEEFTLNGFYRCRFDKIRMRVVGTDQVYTTEEEVLAGTGDIVKVDNTGMYCMHSLEHQPDGKCFDYEIQLCCM